MEVCSAEADVVIAHGSAGGEGLSTGDSVIVLMANASDIKANMKLLSYVWIVAPGVTDCPLS